MQTLVLERSNNIMWNKDLQAFPAQNTTLIPCHYIQSINAPVDV